jgi:hypothetical protein
MKDSDVMRRLIQERLQELGLDAAVVSVHLGFNRGYLHDYIVKGTPKMLAAETKERLAKQLRLPPAALGVSVVPVHSVVSGFADEAEPFLGGPDFSLPPPHITMYRIKSLALDQHPRGLRPGRIVGFNMNDVDPAHILPGQVVLAQLVDRHEGLKGYGTIVRQFLPPDKLVTNSTQTNDMMALNDPSRPYTAIIRGTMAWVMDLNNGQHVPVSDLGSNGRSG